MADIHGGPPYIPVRLLPSSLARRLPFRIRSIQRILRRPAQLRAWARHSNAPRRHRIWKVTLADTLFNLLDFHKVGALGMDELIEFALITGSQGGVDELYDQAARLLDTWGSSLGSRFSSDRICMLQFRQIVSHSGPLHMRKYELRRTIRFARALGPACPMTPHEFSLWRSFKHAKILREALQWRHGIVWSRYDPAFLPAPARRPAALLAVP